MRSRIKVIALVGVIAAFIIVSDTVRQSVLNSFIMCAKVLLPALFPFFILSGLLIDFGLDVLMPPAWCCFCIGTVCGYPLGTRSVCTYYRAEKLSEKQANRLLACSACASPAFLVSAVGGGILGDTKTGYLLLAAQFISSLIFFLCFVPNKFEKQKSRAVSVCMTDALINNVHGAVKQIGFVCAMTVFFGIFCDIFITFLPLKQWARLLVSGGLEIMHGLQQYTRSISPPVLAAIIGWSGLCVWMQCAYYIIKTDLQFRYLVFGKIYQSISIPVIFWLLLSL